METGSRQLPRVGWDGGREGRITDTRVNVGDRRQTHQMTVFTQVQFAVYKLYSNQDSKFIFIYFL